MLIRIGHKDYEVRAFSVTEARENADANGVILYEKQVILVRSDLPAIEQARVLLHEVMHGCFDFAGQCLGGSDELLSEEAAISFLDRGLTAVFLANPYLTAVLHQAIHHGQAVVSE